MTRAVQRMTLGAIALLALIAGCAVQTPDTVRTLAVQPRVVIDGVIALGDRAERVVVDEVVFHAPSVTVRQQDVVMDDLLAGDPSPLLFRYDANGDRFGDVVGERSWTLTDDAGELVVGFEPLQAGTAEIIELESASGVELDVLAGHTAAVHGYVMVTAQSSGFGRICSGEGVDPTDCTDEEVEGDPDGNPSEGDPDGNPSKGDEAEGDPDGNPADPADGDPDGNPADTDETSEGDPDGNPADGDPDGNPADGVEGEGQRREAQSLQESTLVNHETVVRERVPFTLVLNTSFALRVPMAELFQGAVRSGEVKPLDLHVDMNALISEELIALLDASAQDEEPGAIVVVLSNVDGGVGLTVDTAGVRRRARESVHTGGIRVVGDHR